VTDGSDRFGHWYDPMAEFNYQHPKPEQPTPAPNGVPRPRPLLLFVPPVVGNSLSPFAQYPHLHRVFDILAFKTDLEADVSTAEQYQDFINSLASFCREQSSVMLDGDELDRDVYLAGECAGAIHALATALTLSEGGMGGQGAQSDSSASGYLARNPLKEVVTINPATSHTVMAPLISVTKRLLDSSISDFEWYMTASQYGMMRGYSQSEPARYLSLMLNNPIFDPSKCPQSLRDYFLRVIPPFCMELLVPRRHWVSGLHTIECGAQYVEVKLRSEPPRRSSDCEPFIRTESVAMTTHATDRQSSLTSTAKTTMGIPVLIVAGTDDTFVGSLAEAPRLKGLLDAYRHARDHRLSSCGAFATTDIHWVEGAGHGGTLDDRCDLAVVMCKWIRTTHGHLAIPPPRSATSGSSHTQATRGGNGGGATYEPWSNVHKGAVFSNLAVFGLTAWWSYGWSSTIAVAATATTPAAAIY